MCSSRCDALVKFKDMPESTGVNVSARTQYGFPSPILGPGQRERAQLLLSGCNVI